MAYDEGLAQRLRECFERRERLDVEEKKMFGGLAFMVAGHMCCGVIQEELMVRVGKEGHAEALSQPHAREMDFTGRSLKTMVYVGVEGIEDGEQLDAWVERGLAHVESLPPK